MKNKYVATILALLFGGFGVHKFYLGKTKEGLVYLLLVWTAIPCLLGLIDGIKLLLQSKEAFDSKYNDKSNTPEVRYADALYKFKGVDGQMYVYDNRVIITRKGFGGNLTHTLSGNKTIPFKSIESVQFKEPGITNGYIYFATIGGSAQLNVTSIINNENTIVFSKSKNAIANEIKDFIESKIY